MNPASVRAGRERSSASSPGPGGASLGAQAPSSKSSVRKGSRIGCSVAVSEASAPPSSRRGIIPAGGVLATRRIVDDASELQEDGLQISLHGRPCEHRECGHATAEQERGGPEEVTTDKTQ